MNVIRLLIVAAAAAGTLSHLPARAQEAEPPQENAAPAPDAPPEELEPLTPEAQAAADDLQESLPPDSEARAMLDGILAGSRLGPGEGWFKVAVSQTRFGWEYARRYDADGDGKIAPDEFPGPAADFKRLDRDGDRAVSSVDFDWTRHALSPTPGMMLFYYADEDSNGQVTRDELGALFDSFDTTGQGFLSLDELRDQFQPPSGPGDSDRPDKPSRSTLVLGLARQEIGSLEPGPALDQPLVDFTLSDINGQREVTLSGEVGPQPIVLVFGNFTCGPFRLQGGNIEKLYQRYHDRARFFMVYVREAHPKDGWWMLSNRRFGIDPAQPQTDGERLLMAETCQRQLKFSMPFLVDTVDDKVGAAWSGMPNRLYLIDGDGRIAFKSGRGPFGFKTGELEQALILLLAEKQAAGSTGEARPPVEDRRE